MMATNKDILSKTQIENIRIAQRDLIKSQLFSDDVKNVNQKLPYQNIQLIRMQYKATIQGVAIALSLSYDKLESILDDYGLGSHDLMHLLEYNTARDLYELTTR